jgi:hypothetical protein
MCKVFFWIGQMVSWYIMITYATVILPYSEPTSNKALNLFLVGFNYCLFLLFCTLHQYSWWKVSFSDAGYFSTIYKSKRIGPLQITNLPTEASVSIQGQGDQQDIPQYDETKIKYEIFEREELK